MTFPRPEPSLGLLRRPRLRLGVEFLMRRASAPLLLGALLGLGAACGPASNVPQRPPLAEKWLRRAQESYRQGDFEDAKESVDQALRVAPHDRGVRTLGARIALAHLDFAATLELTAGATSSEAHGLRGRADWYSDDIDGAADELDAMLEDPDVKDPWARDIARLARKGSGRHPFAMEGGVVAEVDMPPAGSALIVPCELEGEKVLTMVATGSAEVVIDAASRTEPTWVSMRFGDSIDVHDIPALTKDLSGVSRQIGAPIKALLGVNLLRHLHATFDRRGAQFVVRQSEPPPPPDASRVPLYYVRGGGMLLRAQVSPREDGTSTFFVDSAQPYSVAVDQSLWLKAGVDPKTLVATAQIPNAKAGRLPSLGIGGMSFPGVPAFSFTSLRSHLPAMDVHPGGIFGAGLLEAFRVTFADGGKYVWLEPDPTMTMGTPPAPAPPPMLPDPSVLPDPKAQGTRGVRP